MLQGQQPKRHKVRGRTGANRQESKRCAYERHHTHKKRTVYYSKHINAESAVASSYFSGKCSVRNIDTRPCFSFAFLKILALVMQLRVNVLVLFFLHMVLHSPVFK